MLSSGEEHRLDHGPAIDAAAGFLVDTTARCHDPTEMLFRVREVLRIVLAQRDPDSEAVVVLLPAWFLEACGPEMTIGEAEAWLAAWRTDPAAHESDPWSVRNWLWTFEPDQRSWWWWDADVVGEDEVRTTVIVEGLPFGPDNLVWLLRAAGARGIFRH